jgi:hypothetical protein
MFGVGGDGNYPMRRRPATGTLEIAYREFLIRLNH